MPPVTFYDPARAVLEFRHLLEAHDHPRFGEPAWHLALRLTDERDTAARYADVKRQAHYDYDGRNSFRAGFRSGSHLVARGEGAFSALLSARCERFLVSRGLATKTL